MVDIKLESLTFYCAKSIEVKVIINGNTLDFRLDYDDVDRCKVLEGLKDLYEALGVPIPEQDLRLIDEELNEFENDEYDTD